MQPKHYTNNGFTIVELLIVIVVIGILAAITIVAYNGIQGRAQYAAVSSALTQAAKKLNIFVVDNGAYPPNLSAIGVADSGGAVYQYSVDNGATPKTYCLTATSGASSGSLSSTITNPIPGGCAGHGLSGVPDVTNLALNPRAVAGSLGWSANLNTVHTVTKGVAVNGHPNGIMTAAKSQLVVGSPANSQVLSMYNMDGMNSSAVSRSVSIWVYVSSANNQGRLYGTGNPGQATTVLIPAQTWTLVQTATPIVGNVILTIGKTDGNGNADPSDYAYATGCITVAGSKTYNFADGNSLNWVWNGTVNNSTSTGPLL